MRYLTITLLLLFVISISFAQEEFNQTNAAGDPIGYWMIKGEDGRFLAKGRYNDAGEKNGEWRYFMSPISRLGGEEPDVIGTYENGVKHGKWEVYDARAKITLKGSFENGEMNGVWIYYDQDEKKLAAGKYQNGVREGEWVLFKEDNVMTKGIYRNGLRVGNWEYDYFVERGGVHIVGNLDFEKNQGKMEYYKVERHKSFGVEELIVGVGYYLNGVKTGRWIEYSRGTKGELITTGYYDGDGTKTGRWITTLSGRTFREEAFNDGERQGVFKTYFENGKPKYATSFDNGVELGLFSSHFENGKLESKGANTIIPMEGRADTVYYKIRLPFEYKLKLVDEDFEKLNYNAIDWIDLISYSIASEELEGRWQEYLEYGREKQFRVDKVIPRNRVAVRIGKYTHYYSNGNVFMEGSYVPKLIFGYNPIKGRRERTFAMDGEWIEYDEVGYLRYKYFYDKGTLLRMEDSKGRELSKEDMNAIIK